MGYENNCNVISPKLDEITLDGDVRNINTFKFQLTVICGTSLDLNRHIDLASTFGKLSEIVQNRKYIC